MVRVTLEDVDRTSCAAECDCFNEGDCRTVLRLEPNAARGTVFLDLFTDGDDTPHASIELRPSSLYTALDFIGEEAGDQARFTDREEVVEAESTGQCCTLSPCIDVDGCLFSGPRRCGNPTCSGSCVSCARPNPELF